MTGTELTQLREHYHWTRPGLCAALGISARTLRRWEHPGHTLSRGAELRLWRRLAALASALRAEAAREMAPISGQAGERAGQR